MGSIQKALQLYTVRFDAAQDLRSVLAAVKAAGYDGVEFAGLFGHDVAEIRRWLDELGLMAVAGHVSLDDLAQNLDVTVATYRALGCEFIVLGFLEEARRHTSPAFDETIAAVRRAAEACKASGLPLAYHNHNFEFAPAVGGNGLDRLLEGAPALLAQFDTGWLGIAGENPVEWLRRYAGRYTSVHLKDYLKSHGPDFDFCPISHGDALDYRLIIEAAVRGGAKWLIVDQDSDARRPALDAAALSAQYLRSLGY